MSERWSCDPEHISMAVERLRRGAVIGFPTDTVYGAGCRAADEAALARFYAIKRRPEGQPAILLVDRAESVEPWASPSAQARSLMARFWPGPLTVVLPRRPGIAGLGQDGPTLAFRAPNHPVTLELLRQLGEPLASSSANRAGLPPPTDAAAVMSGLPELDFVLDAGPAQIGEPSTIVDLSGDTPRILRRGALSEQELLGPS
jgi:L-threonylcarbamoyladenylate synthase